MQFIEGFNVSLYPHQVTSVYELEKLEKERKISFIENSEQYYLDTNIGVFGDIPGYGKTLSILSVITRDKMEWDISEPFIQEIIEENGPYSSYKLKTKISYKKINSNLIVVPSSIVGQWEKEILKFNISYIKITKQEHIRKLVEDENQYQIVLCCSTRYNDLISCKKEIAWKRLIYDEAASTCITSMKEIYAGFSWYVSATFEQLIQQNRRRNYLSDIFRGMPYLVLRAMTIKNEDDYVKTSYSLPPPIIYHHECINPDIYNIIDDIINENVRELISAGDIRGAIRSLGGTDTDQNIVELVTKNKRLELKEAEHKAELHHEHIHRGTAFTERYEKWKGRVEDLKKQIENLESRFGKVLENPCSICFDKLENPTMVSCCQNIYCGKCLFEWMKSKPTCPLCRSDIEKKGLISINTKTKKHNSDIIFEEIDDDEKYIHQQNKKMTKPDTIVEIIKNKKSGKFLVFSSHDHTFDIVKRALISSNICYLEIKGTQETRENHLKKYVDGNINVIFLNSKYNGAGINLQNTTDVIMYHRMSESIERQVLGRANRIGRKERLAVHYLE